MKFFQGGTDGAKKYQKIETSLMDALHSSSEVCENGSQQISMALKYLSEREGGFKNLWKLKKSGSQRD